MESLDMKDIAIIDAFPVYDFERRVLSVGCGDGRLSALLEDKVGSLTAIDPDKTVITLAKKNIARVDFKVGSGEKLEFADRSFDIILFSYSLHHQDCVKALDEAKRVLKNDGRILIIEPAPDREYTQFVSIFQEDEIDRLSTTLSHIKSGNFSIIRKEVYFMEYPYTDEKELYSHFIDSFMLKKDAEAVEKMKTILGSKKHSRPIVVRDKVNIFLLKC